jgi:hypothetical protein
VFPLCGNKRTATTTRKRQHQHTSGGNEQQAGVNITSAFRENNKPLQYKQGSYNTRSRQVYDAPVSEKILKFLRKKLVNKILMTVNGKYTTVYFGKMKR